MAGGFIQFTIVEKGPIPGILKRDLNKLAKVAWLSTGRFWHQKFRRKHFTKAGAAEYRYRRRTTEYDRRKFKLFGHTRPLEFTGASRRATRIRDVRATSKGVKIVMRAPTLNLVVKGGRAKGIATPSEELQRVSAPEVQAIARHYAKAFDRVIARVRFKRTTRIN